MPFQTVNRNVTQILFDWTDFPEESLRKAMASRQEDYMAGTVPVQIDKKPYVVDVHYEYQNSRNKCFCLHLFTSDQDNGHVTWLYAIRDIKSANDYDRFRRRVEKMTTIFLMSQQKPERRSYE